MPYLMAVLGGSDAWPVHCPITSSNRAVDYSGRNHTIDNLTIADLPLGAQCIHFLMLFLIELALTEHHVNIMQGWQSLPGALWKSSYLAADQTDDDARLPVSSPARQLEP